MMNGHVKTSINRLSDHAHSEVKVVGIAAAQETPLHELDSSKLTVTRTSTLRPVPQPNSAEVWAAKSCTDHMITATYTDDYGWHAPEIKPYGPLALMPTASCLHYATQCFEGMKVYRGFDGKLRYFRPDMNCKRLAMSSARVALPSFDPAELEKLLIAFLRIDGPRWLPKSQAGSFLYIRPAIIGNGEELGVSAPSEALLFVIAVPWPDISTGVPPGMESRPPGLKLLASKDETRAWPGGFGYAKVGANYGPSFVSHMAGRKKGYDQVLWLLKQPNGDYQVTEAGASNFFVVWKTKEGQLQLVTAPLDGKIILAGVTRASILNFARERLVRGSSYSRAGLRGLEVLERTYTMEEVTDAWKEGRVVEAFVSGTAYFITPVSAINYRDEELEIPMGDGTIGHYAAILKTWLSDIKYGNVEHEWGVVIDESE